jgi:hypothetical protein
MIELKIDSSRTLRENPRKDWREDWDMHIFLAALEEVYALDSKGRFLDAPSIWRTITHDLRKSTRVDSSDMDKLSESYVAYILEQSFLHPIPPGDVKQVLKDLLYAFVGTGNPWRDTNSNAMFHQEFEQALREDEVFQGDRTLKRFLLLCERLIHKWQQNYYLTDWRSGKRALDEPSGVTKDSKKSKGIPAPRAIALSATVGDHCYGCGKSNHERDHCTSGQDPKHPDFNEEGKWIGCATYKTIKAWLVQNDRGDEHPTLRFNFRADGTPLPFQSKGKKDRTSDRGRSSQNDSSSSRGGSHYRPQEGQYLGRRDKGPVQFADNRGTNQLSATLIQPTCSCDDTDVDTSYRMCCITVGDSPSFSAATLFDTGAHTSFVNREIAEWIELQAKGDKGYTQRRRSGPKTETTSVSLAGTPHTSAILGSVVFDLTFFNEVTQSHETIHNIHAQVLDSCIAVIIGRPLIRENHLVQKIPLYFDEVTRSKPNQSQSVLPVTSLSSTRARCRGTQSCVTCAPFVAQGYDDTLCSLSVLRTDHPHVPTERRRRPHVGAFAEHPLTDGSRLIPRSALLDAVEDDDDIDWPEDPFDRPDSASPKSPDELLAMIHFEGSPALQDALRALCREFIDIFDTAVRPLPAKVDAMVIEIDRSKWELPQNRLPQRGHSAEKQQSIRTQVDALLQLGVIEESRATHWSQVHPVRKPDGSFRLTLDFVKLNATTSGLEGWPIPNIQQALSRLGTLKPTVFGLLDFTAGYHQTPLAKASRALTAFSAVGGLYQWTRVAMGLKGAGPYFQRSMSNTVLAGLVYRICELYIDDVLIHGKDPETFLANVRKVFERLREFNVAVNPKKTKLGLAEVEYVGHVVSATGTSFTEEKRLKVLQFPLPETQKNLLQFIGLANYFRDHVPRMTEMVQPLRKLIPLKAYKGSGKLVWTPEAIAAFEYCQQAISNCQELYFLEDTAIPILQTDASDYGIGGYLFMVTNGRVRVVRFFSKALIGPQLNWSVREKECYGIFYGVRLFEDLLDNRPFILKTDHMNLTYLNVTLTGKVLRWKLYLQDKDFHLHHVPGKEVHQGVPDALSRLCENHMPPKQVPEIQKVKTATLSALQPKQHLSNEVYDKIAAVHNSSVGHWGQAKCRLKLDDPSVTDRMISTFIRQCPCCQVMSRLKIQIKTHPFTCASYHPFEVIHLDHIGPLRPDTHGNMYILVLIDAFSRWVELFPTKTTSALESASCIFQHMGRFGTPEVLHTDRGTAFHNELVSELLRMTGTEQSLATAYSSEENGIVERANQEVLRHLNAILFDSRIHDKWSYEQLPMVQRIMNTVEKTSTGVTPAALILNNSIRLTERILLPPTQARSSGQFALSDTMDDWIARQCTLINVAREKQRQTDFHALVEYDPTITEYPVHSYVLFTPPVGRSDKLLPRHRGPFQVLDRTNSIYTIEDLISGKRTTTHIHNLRPFNYDPDRTSPVTVAQQNEQEFVVESIISHRGNRNSRSTMEFKVRWAGFGVSCDSWEPYKALMHVDKLHDYLRTNTMKTLIPKEHK